MCIIIKFAYFSLTYLLILSFKGTSNKNEKYTQKMSS